MGLKAALDLMRRLPPSQVEDNLADLTELAPQLQDDLLSTIDQPLQLERDSSGREFLLCDYNRDGDSYRSARARKLRQALQRATRGHAPLPRARAPG